MKKIVVPILIVTIWISLSEFFRNQLLVNSYWVDHYHSLGLDFPSKPLNGAIWGLWSLIFAAVIYVLATKFTFKQTITLAWVVGFLMMWLVLGNLAVLPLKILIFAIPLSWLEVVVATYIVFKFKPKQDK